MKSCVFFPCRSFETLWDTLDTVSCLLESLIWVTSRFLVFSQFRECTHCCCPVTSSIHYSSLVDICFLDYINVKHLIPNYYFYYSPQNWNAHFLHQLFCSKMTSWLRNPEFTSSSLIGFFITQNLFVVANDNYHADFRKCHFWSCSSPR